MVIPVAHNERLQNMKILNGSLNNIIFFVALDSVNGASRETGYTAGDFTVYYQLDGGSKAVMTTPTIAELDDTNMQGVYSLLINEALMTQLANDKSEELVIHITHAGMREVTRYIEVYAKENNGKFHS